MFEAGSNLLRLPLATKFRSRLCIISIRFFLFVDMGTNAGLIQVGEKFCSIINLLFMLIIKGISNTYSVGVASDVFLCVIATNTLGTIIRCAKCFCMAQMCDNYNQHCKMLPNTICSELHFFRHCSGV